MASPSNKKLLVSPQKTFKGELSVLTMSDYQIKEKICGTHAHIDNKFDVGSLFTVVKNILNPVTIVVDNVVQGTKQAYVEIQGERAPEASFIPPLCTLKQLSYEMACKPFGVEIAHKTTMLMLNKLSSYSWHAKAVLTLAAFALDYGEFWHLAQFYSSDQLTKSLGFLKRVPVILMRPGIEKHGKTIVELNNLIKDTLAVIECIFKLEELSVKYDTIQVPSLSTAMDNISVNVYWAIITVAACTTQMCCLLNDEAKAQELLPFAGKINVTLNLLKEQMEACDQDIAEIEAYRNLKRLLQSPTEIVEVLKALIFVGDNGQRENVSTNELIISNIEVVKKKNVLLFFSGMDISDGDISILKPIYEEIKKKNQYTIVWIPIVEQWTDEIQKKFEILRSKMPWYIVQHFSSAAGIKYVKEDWHFKNTPIIVVLNPQGIVEHPNARQMIINWGINAFPFTVGKEQDLINEINWFGPSIFGSNGEVINWIKQEKYIFYYGGKDNYWIQQFFEKATNLKNDTVIKGASISIELFRVGKNSKGEDDPSILGRFWNVIDYFFFSKSHEETKSDTDHKVTEEFQKLLSYKTESGWAVLCKGSKLVFSGHGTIVLNVLEQFDQWKQFVQQKIAFEICFKERHDKIREDEISKAGHPCRHFAVPKNDGKIPESIKCPDCEHVMEMYIEFKCCHNYDPMNAFH